ncbi:PQQ-dependent sugar dehydrogenase [Lysinibacillus fusiformis]|uniref:PQQ-dependent sugar dehydrogenase n=1 Tax=Lysinibacillus fusiformis TaxID=28031 RepID=UPI00215B3F6E|nr:PQQ-dependent sugar dehydrogenase [Lysinibacillus fusiformis]MCR8852897.1 PQQ-dependent sugar dehydrogenase [Lysinibacillus fusiformis]WKT75651.1 PQQ-dependent sugar dehydrogenase [Lysinibacillus fusiformis]
MKRMIPVLLLAIIMCAACTSTKGKDERKVKQEEPSKVTPNVEIIAEQLQTPWSIEKSDTALYVTERPGNIVMITEDVVERQQVLLKKQLSAAPEAGLLGFVLAPDFTTTNIAYAYYTYEEGSAQFNRVVTLILIDNKWQETDLLIDRIQSGTYHHGGRLKIGPDSKLYVTVGDATQPSLAQDLDALEGKILRLNLDGSIPNDNPFPRSYVYSYGHRNPQGLAWATDGTMYASEHGNAANDEINIIEKGKNYGWPLMEGTDKQQHLVTPLFTSGSTKTWAPSGITVVDDQLYAAALRGTAVLTFDVNMKKQDLLLSEFGRIRDVFMDDSYLYFISNNTDGRGNPQPDDDKLYRTPL